jgi:Sulfite exporter TauE/SafE
MADNVCPSKETPPSAYARKLLNNVSRIAKTRIVVSFILALALLAVLGNNLLEKACSSLRLSRWKFHGSAVHRLQNIFVQTLRWQYDIDQIIISDIHYHHNESVTAINHSYPAFHVMARDSETSRRLGPGNDDFFEDFSQDDMVLVDDRYYSSLDDKAFDSDKDATPKLFPLEKREVVGFFIASLALSLGASGGTGGGGIVVPIYILVIGLPIQAAIPIGAFTVFGGALACTSLNWSRRHPLADRVLIDWDLILVMEPLMLVGTLLGTLFHRLLSEKILVVLLVLLLSVTAHTTLSKAMRMYLAEKRYIRYLRAARSDPPLSGSPSTVTLDETSPMSPTSDFMNEANISKYLDIKRKEENDVVNNQLAKPTNNKLAREEKEEILILNPDYVTLRSELIEQEKFTPTSKILTLFCLVSVLTFLNIMAGGGENKSPWDVACGSTAFWIIHALMIIFLVSTAWAAQTYVVARHEIKELVRFDYVRGKF